MTLPFLQQQLNDINKRIGDPINAMEEGAATASAENRQFFEFIFGLCCSSQP